jgi:hypothetical protein
MAIIDCYQDTISRYIRAKDDNKPHLMDSVFTLSADLEMITNTEAIAFPANTHSRDGITQVLVRDFSQRFENVYTFCLTDTIEIAQSVLCCQWLVVMSGREDGELRIGCGNYHWEFEHNTSPLVQRLAISITAMVILPRSFSHALVTWANTTAYPWCNLQDLLSTMPVITELDIIRKTLGAVDAS